MKPKALPLLLALTLALPAAAADYWWKGGNTTGDKYTTTEGYTTGLGSNWEGNAAPAGTSMNLFFGEVAVPVDGYLPFNNVRSNLGQNINSKTIASLNFLQNATAGYRFLSCNDLLFADGASITNDSPYTVEIVGNSSGRTHGLLGSLVLNANAGDLFLGNTVYADNASATAPTDVTKNGAYAVTFNQTQTFTGNLTVNAGVVRLLGSGTLGDTTDAGTGKVILNGGDLDLATTKTASLNRALSVTAASATLTAGNSAGTTGHNYNFGALSIGSSTLHIRANASVTAGGATVTFNGALITGDAVFDVGDGALLSLGVSSVAGGAHGDAGTSLTKTGAGLLHLYAVNTTPEFYGNITLLEGDLRFQNSVPMGTHTFTIGGGRVLSNAYNQHRQLGGNLVLNGSFTYGDTAFSGCISFVSTNDTLLQTTPVITTLRNSTFLADALGRFTYADGTTDTHTANGSQLVLTGSLKDNGLGFGLTKEGDGRLVLQGLLSDYSGDVTLNTGFLEVRGDAQSLGSGSLVLNGGLLRLAPQGATGTFSYANSGVALNADATLVLDRYSLTVAVTHRFGDLAVNAPATFSVLHGYNVAANADATLQFGNITLSGATTFDVGEGAVLVLGKVSGNSVPITKTGAGTLRFDATSGVSASNGTYGDIILEDGWLQFRFTPAETAPASVGGNLILRGGKLSSNDTPSRTFYRPLAIEGDVTLGDTVANGTLVFNGSITLSGVRSLNILSKVCFNGTVTGGGLEKSGAGELAINGVNGDFGPVALREGRLSNTGKIGGAVFLGDTGALEASVGLKAGAVSFGSTLNITLDLAGAVQGGTAITLDSLAAAGSSVSLTLLNANDALLDGYTLLSIGSTLLSASDFHISGTSLDWEFAGGALQLSAPIPEPATTALLLALAALALFWVHTKGTKSPNF